MKRLEQTEYTVKLHEGIKTLVFIYFLNPKLISLLKKEEIMEYIFFNLKKKENRKYHLVALDVVEQINKKDSKFDLSSIRCEVVKISLLEMMRNLRLFYFENKLYSLIDKNVENNEYTVNDKTLKYFDDQLYPKIMNAFYEIIYDCLIRLINPLYNVKYISISEKTSKALYSDEVENKNDKLVMDLFEWIYYNNLDYFLNVEQKEDKIILRMHLI